MTLSKATVTWTISCEQDDLPVRGNALASGDDATDKACEDEILKRLDDGDVWAWGIVRVCGRYGPLEAEEYIGACSYTAAEDFIAGGYYESMQEEVLEQLQQAIDELQELQKVSA